MERAKGYTPVDPYIFVILLNWNGREDTLNCLSSLRALDYKRRRVIVVDNASTDGSAELIAERFPEATLIRNPVNAGFDGGNNIGMRAALRDGADAVLLLNNDTIVCAGLLRHFADAATSLPRAGILGPKIYYHERPDVFWWAGCRRSYSTTGWLLNYTQDGKGEKDRGQFEEIRRIDAVIGCAMYIKSEVLKTIGLLDERFFIYHEEYDFCRRAEESGWHSYFVPGAKLWHKVSMSMGGQYSPSLYFLWTRNWLLLSRKHTPARLWPLLYYAYLKESLWVYQGLMEKGMVDAAEASLAGARDALRNRFGPIKTLQLPRWLSRAAAWHYRRGGGGQGEGG
ncbi:MAG: glycosyltransferase family 2 protein [Chlamydiota bacterium]